MSPTAVAQKRLKVSDTTRDVLVTGGTGYIGSALIPALLERGHRVRVLTRQGSAGRVPEGAEAVVGDPLSIESIKSALRFGDTIVHLVGTSELTNEAELERVDLGSIRATVGAARGSGVLHLVYVSVAQPSPVMRAYVAARAAGERVIEDAGMRATVLRPLYVLGPGRRWPALLAPLYAVAAVIPGLRQGARRAGLVTLQQMVRALVRAVEHPAPRGTTIIDVPMIKQVVLTAHTGEAG
jgi:uncharacterized protein YbjT (DUF2867 family)